MDPPPHVYFKNECEYDSEHKSASETRCEPIRIPLMLIFTFKTSLQLEMCLFRLFLFPARNHQDS